MRSLLGIVTAVLSLGLLPQTVSAQTFPEKPIEIVVGYAAGGPADLLARQTATFLAKHLGGKQPVVVVNQPGASGIIASTAVANATPDGYKLTLFNHPGLAGSLIGQAEQPYTMSSFDFLGVITDEPSVVFVADNSPYQTLGDLIEAAKAAPDTITVGASGVGLASHLGLKLIESAADVRFVHIPSAGASESATQVMGGHIDAATTTVSGVLALYNSGQIRILGVASKDRVPNLPDLPTFHEQGVDVEWSSTRGLPGPAGIPDDVKKTLSDALEASVKDPEFVEQAERQGLSLAYSDGPTFVESASKQIDILNEIWKTNPWQ